MNQVVTQGARTPAPAFTAESLGFTEHDARFFAQAQFYALSTIVPKEYQGNASNCYIAIKTAARMKKDPLFVMNNLSVIHGRPGWSSKGLHQLAKEDVLKDLKTPVDKTDPDNWKCTAVAVTKEGETVTGMEISVKMAKAWGWWDRNAIWRNGTELMLKYRAAAWLINTEFPEVTMGFPTREEIEDTSEMQQKATAATQTLNQLLAAAAEAKPEVPATSVAPETIVVVQKSEEPAHAPIPTFDGSEVEDLPDMSELSEGQQSVEMFKRIAALVKQKSLTEAAIEEKTGYTKTQIRKLTLIQLVEVYSKLSK